MPSKKNPQSQKEQSDRFLKDVADLVAAGELNPTEADVCMEKFFRAPQVKKASNPP